MAPKKCLSPLTFDVAFLKLIAGYGPDRKPAVFLFHPD